MSQGTCVFSQHHRSLCTAGAQVIDTFAGLRRRLQGPAPVMVMGQASQHNYSAHMSTSLALGFLFMAGGTSTFSTSPQATAALVIALFPRFPHSPTDHRCHLQVSRSIETLITFSKSCTSRPCIAFVSVADDVREPHSWLHEFCAEPLGNLFVVQFCRVLMNIVITCCLG